MWENVENMRKYWKMLKKYAKTLNFQNFAKNVDMLKNLDSNFKFFNINTSYID